jgi:predicted ATPase
MNFFRQMIKTVPGWSQQIAKHFSQVFGIDKPFNVQFFPKDQKQKWAQGWIAPEDQVAFTIDSYGDGARSTFKALTPLLALAELAKKDAPGLFIREEPELFQNPQSLGCLLKEVADLMNDKPMQLFIATHSLEVVAHFTALVQQGKIEHDDLMAFRLGLRDGKLSSSWFNADNLTAWLEEGLAPLLAAAQFLSDDPVTA